MATVTVYRMKCTRIVFQEICQSYRNNVISGERRVCEKQKQTCEI